MSRRVLVRAAAVAVFALLVLWITYRHAENGRYAVHTQGPYTWVIDTRTGLVYRMTGGGWSEFNPHTGAHRDRGPYKIQ